jgi:nucleoside-diphosphate-sugar epimerase
VNVGSEEALSIREIAEIIGRVVGREPVIEEQAGEIGGDFVGDITAMCRTFRLPARLTSFEDGVRVMTGLAGVAGDDRGRGAAR